VLHCGQVTIPENGQSFALIYSIEDPADPRSPVGGVGAQVMGPDDGYICQVGQDGLLVLNGVFCCFVVVKLNMMYHGGHVQYCWEWVMSARGVQACILVLAVCVGRWTACVHMHAH
jgi:hypothetical protein